MQELSLRLIRQRSRLLQQHKKFEIDNPEKTFTFFGGFDSGYIKGKVSAIEDILDEIYPDWEAVEVDVEVDTES